MTTNKKYILTKEIADKKLRRMALEICERNQGESELLLIGIKGSGMVVAEKISQYINGIFSGNVTVHCLQIDKKEPGAVQVQPPADCKNKVVVLIDDVANSGKTMLYALKPLLEAYPKKIQTLALVERTHKSFPVDIDYTGISVSTSFHEHIYVEVNQEEVLGAWMEGMTAVL
jgi:pyrimidine operon attenuation protein / uracil phosphoribosyltransferase